MSRLDKMISDGILAQADAQLGAAEEAEAEERETKRRVRAKAEAARKAEAKRKADERRVSRDGGREKLPSERATGWTTPVQTITISASYGQSGNWSSGYHTGVDFVVSTGTPVRAVGAGTVVSALFEGAYGNTIVIRHPDGMYTQYAHLSSLGVSAGQSVSGGQRIGLSGSTGNSTGPHLHFEARSTPFYGSDTNPLAYLRRHGVRI